MALIDDLIKDLPAEIQEMVRVHLVTVTRMKADELIQWIQQITARHYNGAYRSLNDKMLPEERLAEQIRLNDMIEAYNRENKKQLEMWLTFFNTLLTILIQKGMAEIIEPGS
jgi:hypothetical protein